jgi:hypothetical protein
VKKGSQLSCTQVSIQHFVITIVSDLLQVSWSLLHVFEIPLSIMKLTTSIWMTYCTETTSVPVWDYILLNCSVFHSIDVLLILKPNASFASWLHLMCCNLIWWENVLILILVTVHEKMLRFILVVFFSVVLQVKLLFLSESTA